MAFPSGNRDEQLPRLSLLDGWAAQPQIVRAAQKDEFYCNVLYERLYDAWSAVLGPRSSIRRQKDIQWLAAFVYFWLTTWRGLPSLGEEYCDIRQVISPDLALFPTSSPRTEAPGHHPPNIEGQVTGGNTDIRGPPGEEGSHGLRVEIPTQAHRSWMLACEIIFPYWLEKAHNWLSVLSQPRHSGRYEWITRQDIKDKIQHMLQLFSDARGTLQRFHLGLFYLEGFFFHFTKRLSSSVYVFNHKPQGKQTPYGILGILLMIQLLVTGLVALKRAIVKRTGRGDAQHADESPPPSDLSNEQCTLCLEERKKHHCDFVWPFVLLALHS